MSEHRFKQALVLLGLAALIAIISMVSATGPSTSTAQLQPLSPEWTKDFTRRVLEDCDRRDKLPVAYRERMDICDLPRR